MLSLSNNLLEKLSVWKNGKNQSQCSNEMEIHLVNQNDIFYKKGRILASDVYHQVWKTEKLIDDNHYGIVVTHQGKVVGNVNIQLRLENQPVKSEKFFGEKHWQYSCDISEDSIVEMSGLSIGQDVPPELRQPIMMLLLFSTYTLARSMGRTFCVTIQRKALYRILTKHLHLPIFPNKTITDTQGEVPDDTYWHGSEKPQLYYIDGTSAETIEAMNSYFFYLTSIGISTKFHSRFDSDSTSYAQFRKSFLPKAAAV